MITFNIQPNHSDYLLIGVVDNSIIFKEEIPSRKIHNKKYMKKAKDRILNRYDNFCKLIHLIKNLNIPSAEVEQPEPYFPRYETYSKRYHIDEYSNILVKVKKTEFSEEIDVVVYYERFHLYNKSWEYAHIYTITIDDNKKLKHLSLIKQTIENVIQCELEIIQHADVLSETIINALQSYDVYYEKVNFDYWSSHGVFRVSKPPMTRTITRIKSTQENETLALVLETDYNNKHILHIYKEFEIRYGLYANQDLFKIKYNGTFKHLNQQLERLIHQEFSKKKMETEVIRSAQQLIEEI